MRRLVMFGTLISLIAFGSGSFAPSVRAVPLNVDVSQRSGQEDEEAIAVNPTNPNNIAIVTNIAEGTSGLFAATSFDGGLTWSRRIIGNGDNLGDACCDPSLAFDSYGNLFFTYLRNTGAAVPVALSTDGGISYNVIASIAKPAKQSPPGVENQKLFRFTDQPTIATGAGSVWVVFNAGPMVATGAAVSGLGVVGAFSRPELAPGTNNCTYSDIAIGPSGQVIQVCTLTQNGQGGGKLFVNVDPDGLGPQGFGDRIFVAATHVGGFDFITPQPDRSVDAEPGLAWDRSGGAHNGRVYLIYTLEVQNEKNDTDVMLRYSDDGGATWSSARRVNDDSTHNAQFLPKISLDQTTGQFAVTWYDSRNDLGTGGPGDTDGIANDDAQYWGTFSSNGVSFAPNIQISGGTSNAPDSGNPLDYGDYSGLSFNHGIAHPAWADNSNSTGDNPDGALHGLDIYSTAISPP